MLYYVTNIGYSHILRDDLQSTWFIDLILFWHSFKQFTVSALEKSLQKRITQFDKVSFLGQIKTNCGDYRKNISRLNWTISSALSFIPTSLLPALPPTHYAIVRLKKVSPAGSVQCLCLQLYILRHNGEEESIEGTVSNTWHSSHGKRWNNFANIC